MRMRPISRSQRVARHFAWSITIYCIVYQLLFRHASEWVGLVFVLNMIAGYQMIDNLYKRMGTTVVHEAYSFVGCVRFLVMAMAWPVCVPMLRNKAESYEACKRQALAPQDPSVDSERVQEEKS